MDRKIITITAKGNAEQHSFECQVVTIADTRTYVLANTKRNNNLSDFAPGCKVFDDGKLYRIEKIWYSPSPLYAFIAVYRDLPV